LITLTSDFGLKDPYVAEMKGIMLSLNLDVKIVDITHQVEQFNIRMGAFMLASAAPYFPKGTVHLAVVDPGVGTERRAIIVQTKNNFFVGPDNGLLILAAEQQSIQHIYQLTNAKFMRPKVSSTFHGRDVFAPAAVYLDMGIAPQEFGPEIFDPIKPDFVSVKKNDNTLVGEVLRIDSFGNIITNINEYQLNPAKKVKVKLPTLSVRLDFGKTYTQASHRRPIALIGSHGFLEVALNQGNAAQRLETKSGDIVEVTLA